MTVLGKNEHFALVLHVVCWYIAEIFGIRKLDSLSYHVALFA